MNSTGPQEGKTQSTEILSVAIVVKTALRKPCVHEYQIWCVDVLYVCYAPACNRDSTYVKLDNQEHAPRDAIHGINPRIRDEDQIRSGAGADPIRALLRISFV